MIYEIREMKDSIGLLERRYIKRNGMKNKWHTTCPSYFTSIKVAKSNIVLTLLEKFSHLTAFSILLY